jgi:putative polyhydroxyalkanoate system protein
MTISIERQHNLGAAAARQKIEAMTADLAQKYGVKLAWTGNNAALTGSGFSGSLVVEEKRVALDVKLGLMLRPLGGKIKEALERGVDKALA